MYGSSWTAGAGLAETDLLGGADAELAKPESSWWLQALLVVVDGLDQTNVQRIKPFFQTLEPFVILPGEHCGWANWSGLGWRAEKYWVRIPGVGEKSPPWLICVHILWITREPILLNESISKIIKQARLGPSLKNVAGGYYGDKHHRYN